MKYLKIGEHLVDAPEELTDEFVVEIGCEYQLQISKVDGKLKVTNGVNGWGHNCREEFKDAEVKVLVEENTPHHELDVEFIKANGFLEELN